MLEILDSGAGVVDLSYRWGYRNTNIVDGDHVMQFVTVSPKYQVVIPRPVRDRLNLRPGQKMQVVVYAGRVELIPQRDISELQGFVKGIDTTVAREADRV